MMLREMRRKDRALPKEDIERLLQKGEYGILSTAGADGQPYGVPVNYAYETGKIYFHCAAHTGLKEENLKQNPRVCFTIVGDTQVLPAQFSTRFESVIAFGTVSPAPDKFAALAKICAKYSPDYQAKGEQYAQSAQARVDVWELHIDHVTGKGRRN